MGTKGETSHKLVSCKVESMTGRKGVYTEMGASTGEGVTFMTGNIMIKYC